MSEIHPSIKFAMSLREDVPSPRQRIQEEIHQCRVRVEDEWQTAEDHLDDNNLAEAEYFLERLISQARKLKQTIAALSHFDCTKSSNE